MNEWITCRLVLAIICNLANNNVSNSDYGVTCYGNQHIIISAVDWYQFILGSENFQGTIICCTACTARSDTLHYRSFGSHSSVVRLMSSRTWCCVTGQAVLTFWTFVVPSKQQELLAQQHTTCQKPWIF
jgi:hypothetical protein